MPRFRVTLIDADGEVLPFFTGDLEPGEIGSLVTAATKRMAGEPPGWALSIDHLPDLDRMEQHE